MRKTLIMGCNCSRRDSLKTIADFAHLIENNTRTKLLYFSDSSYTAKHYYEGAILELEIELDKDDETDYLDDFIIPMVDDYKWGMAQVGVPVDKSTVRELENGTAVYYEANWYSISTLYIAKHGLSVREISLEDVEEKYKGKLITEK